MIKQQKSFDQEATKGILYLVPTPIGNLEDMTFRAIRIMKEANVIAAEDTRNTKKLCNYFEITTPIVSYHEHNKEASGPKLIDRIKQGEKIALVSDAGMPCISDPGFDLVQLAIKEDVTVVPLPGANAALTALIAAGIESQPFYFYGFLDRQKKSKKEELEQLAKMQATIILYESPHRLKETLKAMNDILGNRQIVLCRELTKKFEEFLRGTIEEALEWATTQEIKGEFVIILEGTNEIVEETNWFDKLSILEHIDHHMENGLSTKDAIKKVSQERNLPKRDVYNEYHQ